MAKKINWTKTAQNDRKIILEYWVEKNKSKIYSEKLNNHFKTAITTILKLPFIGLKSNKAATRIFVLKKYLIV